MRTPAAVVTIGVFDGFHRGHCRVIERARERADRGHSRLIVVTFDRHPRTVVSPESAPAELASRATTVQFLREAGADEIRVIRFTSEVAGKSPQDFLGDHVFPFSRVGALVVGHDFAMGRERSGHADALEGLGRQLGFSVESVDAVFEGEETISSSRIRELLVAGRVEEARRFLGRPYRLDGLVETGDGRGQTLGFPTANLAPSPNRLRPAQGVYAVRASGPGVDSLGVANVGTRPTFGGGEEKVEVHLFHEGGNLVGRILRVEFFSHLRSERKFNDINELKNQIETDVEKAKALLPDLVAGHKST